MIALIGNRPAILVGRHQVFDYDTRWVAQALRQAAIAADSENFPFLDEIRQGVEEYLETHCNLRILPLPSLFDRLERMLRQVGCTSIAEHLQPVAPPVTLALDALAGRIDEGFELGFFEALRGELRDLRAAGATEIHFSGLRTCVLTLRQTAEWRADCDELAGDIRAFLDLHHREYPDQLSNLPD